MFDPPADGVDVVFLAPLAANKSSKSKALAFGLFDCCTDVVAIVGTEEEEALGLIVLKLAD